MLVLMLVVQSVCFGECFNAKFPHFIASQHLNINQLELLTVLVSLMLCQDRLHGSHVVILTDNQVHTEQSPFIKCSTVSVNFGCSFLNIICFSAHHISEKSNLFLRLPVLRLCAACLNLIQVFPSDSMFAFTVF